MEGRYSNGEKNRSMLLRKCEDARKSFAITVITININGFNLIIDQKTNSQLRLKNKKNPLTLVCKRYS